jgi:pimeloyl-ACP methyl ester carboxylesterase
MPVSRVILLPGVVLPAEPAYGDLISALGPEADVVAKDLELYASPEPPEHYDLDLEVAGVLREADDRGWEEFHLVGYSGGGAASVSLAAARPERLSSLALLEPAWAGNWDLSSQEQAVVGEFGRLEDMPVDQLMPAFTRLQLARSVPLPAPPPGDPPPWMTSRPAGIRLFLRAFGVGEIDREALRRFDRPVYFALGGLSNPDYYAEMARRLNGVFPDFELEVFEERHHFDPPHRIEPERLGASLTRLWRRAEASPRESTTPDPL